MKLHGPLMAIGVYVAGRKGEWKVYLGNSASGMVPTEETFPTKRIADRAATDLKNRISWRASDYAKEIIKSINERQSRAQKIVESIQLRRKETA